MAIDINKIKVEPVYDYFDRADVESVLSRCHPLGAKKAIGRRISYAASYRGEWVAVLLFDKAVDRNKSRKAKIGWSANQERERRQHIANNSRFAILPAYEKIPNLASKVLSMVSARISLDWHKQYGMPLLALETYVDPEHNDNTGTCYEASGWENLGYSTGHLHNNGERTHSKWYFLKALHKDSYKALSSDIPHALLTGLKAVDGQSNNNYVLDASKISLSELQEDLKQVTDPRSQQGRVYELVPLLSFCITAVVSGYTQYRQIADWISKIPSEDRVRFGLPGDRCPHERTIGLFLASIDPVELKEVLTRWLVKTYDKDSKTRTISLDGKALRATSSEAREQKSFLNVFAHELGIVIDHVPTKKGGGELSSARKVLEDGGEELFAGKVILADALHTDKTFVKTLEKKKAWYVLTVKDNQKHLREQIENLLKHTDEKFPELIRRYKTVDKGHGRLETREIFALATHNMKLEIDGIKQVARLYRKREIFKSGKVEEEEIYLITNMHHNKLDEKGFLELKREYWAIENKIHYRKDFVFGEDRSTIRANNGPENMSNLRNFAIGLLMANNVTNVKRCVDNIRYGIASQFHSSIFRKAA